jgi:hypothetical protein
MNTHKLSDYQLYQLSENKKLSTAILHAVQQEINNRNWSTDKKNKLSHQAHEQFSTATIPELAPASKWAMVLFPFFITIHSLIASKYPARNQLLKWKTYWLYLCLGYAIWTVIVVASAAARFF